MPFYFGENYNYNNLSDLEGFNYLIKKINSIYFYAFRILLITKARQ